MSDDEKPFTLQRREGAPILNTTDWMCRDCGYKRAQCENCGRLVLGKNEPPTHRKGVTSNAKRAVIFEAVDSRLKELGYSMAIADSDVAIGTLPNGAILVTHPKHQPIAILINVLDQIPKGSTPDVC